MTDQEKKIDFYTSNEIFSIFFTKVKPIKQNCIYHLN